MPAYQVSVCKITNRTPEFLDYAKRAAPLVAQYGGEYVVRGPASAVLEGEALKGAAVIVTRWPSLDAARAFYESDDYQSIKGLREGSGVYDIALYEAAV